MKKVKTIDVFFKRKSSDNCDLSHPVNDDSPSVEANTSKYPRLETKDHSNHSFDINNLERDPGLRPQIWEYPVNQQDEVIRAYLKLGPYRMHLSEYPLSNEKHPGRFQASWFGKFPWLEYSPTKDAAYCFYCYLFSKPIVCHGTDAFTVKGFNN
ncbi:Zinc finger MYM-type protein [Corchorus olitorius]|uniref:Zinc finger MYM-type protein n=1 Tax=Corchorus olitorius TaxID=93759 RepID=A0A1R3GE71_9ROSI|nr:Zinc finger MYM-type protein [Corchorus olitorius]